MREAFIYKCKKEEAKKKVGRQENEVHSEVCKVVPICKISLFVQGAEKTQNLTNGPPVSYPVHKCCWPILTLLTGRVSS